MCNIISLSLDDECVNILSKIPDQRRSKFIREKIKSNLFPTINTIILALDNKSLNLYAFQDYLLRLHDLYEAQQDN